MSTTNHTHAARRSQAGFTFAEVLMATVIVGFAVISSSWALSGASSAKHELDAEPFTASLLAKEIYECAESLERTPSGTLAVTAGTDILALDSLIGAEFSPPIRADGTADANLSAWTQEVSLDVYALDDLSTPTGEDAWAGLNEHDDRMYQLSVKVLKDGVEIDTYRWWLTP